MISSAIIWCGSISLAQFPTKTFSKRLVLRGEEFWLVGGKRLRFDDGLLVEG